MFIIPDSNILIPDPRLQSQRWRVLLEYAKKTGHKVILLEMVEMEVKAHFQREFKESAARVKRALARVEMLGFSDVPKFTALEAAEAAYQRWLQQINRTVNQYSILRVPIDLTIFPEVLRRATERIAPCSASGKEVRDAVIWLSACSLLKSVPGSSAVFISSNTSDFAAADGKSFREELAREISNSGLSMSYFSKLDEFNAEHAEQYSYLTASWVRERLDLTALDLMISQNLVWAKERLFRISDWDYRDYYEVVSITNVVQLDFTIDDPVMVWDVAKDELEIGISMSIDAKVNAECRRVKVPAGYEDRPRHVYLDEYPDYKDLTCSAELLCHAAAKVRNNEVEGIEILDFEPATIYVSKDT